MTKGSSVEPIVQSMLAERSISAAGDFFALTPEQMVALVRSGWRLPTTLYARIRAFIMLGRPRTCVPGLLCYNLGHYYMEAEFSPRMVLGSFLAFLIGFAANVQNAYSDVEEDSHNLPGRLYLVLQLGYRNLLRISLALAGLMLVGSAVIGINFFLFMVLAVCGSHLYSFGPDRAKERPILGLWVFSQAVAFPFVFGWATEPDRLFHAGMSPLLWLLFGFPLAPDQAIFQGFRYLGMLIFITLWFMAKGTFKNVPDFYGDLAAGVRTSATVCGTWRNATTLVAAATVAAYLSLGVLVALGLESPRILISLVWLIPVSSNCFSLMAAREGSKGNLCLKRDMLLSSGFIATLLLLLDPRWQNWATVAVAALILFASDLFGIDSRRAQDVLTDLKKTGVAA
jgi:4-hydroxybenzoate polyprenyltransferase